MKRTSALLMTLLLGVSCLAGCGNTEQQTASTETTVETSNTDALENAKSYIRLMYKDETVKTAADYQVVGAVVINGESYDIEWTATVTSGAEDAVSVVAGDDKMVTIDINEKASEETAYTLTASIKDASGESVELSFDHIVPKGLDLAAASYEEIVAEAYALEDGANLEGTFRLYGTVTEIGTPYSEEYKNVTVTLAVAGMEEYPIECFRLKSEAGEGVDTIVVGDKITVEGTLKNYNGTIEFDAGCVLLGKEEVVPQSALIEAAYALEDGASMTTPTALTGTITAIDTPYSAEYGNITVTITCPGVEAYPITCYRLSGEGADTLAEGDVIAVFGTIKNYGGTIEFDKGCKLIPVDAVSSARVTANAYTLEDGSAYAVNRTLTGTITAIDTPYSDEYKNITVTITVAGLEEYPIMCYRLSGEGADALAEGDVITVTGIIKNYGGTIEFDKGCTFVK